eukprot:6421886-Prymnesium_polylepis.1
MSHQSTRVTPSASLNAETHVILENHDVFAYLPKMFQGVSIERTLEREFVVCSLGPRRRPGPRVYQRARGVCPAWRMLGRVSA